MRINKTVLCLSFFGFLWAAIPVFASVNTNGQNGVERTISAKPFGKAILNLGLTAGYAMSSDYVQGPIVDGHLTNAVVDENNPQSNVLQDPAKMVSSNIYMGLGLTDFWDFSLALPLYYDWAGFRDLNDGGLGDLEITTKFLFPPISLKKVFYQALIISMTAPTGMRGSGLFPRQTHFIANNESLNPAENFYSADYITVKPVLAFTLDFGASIPLQLHVNIGGVFTEAKKQNTMVGALAVEYKPAEFLTLFADFSGESRWQNLSAGYNIRKDPLWATPGVRITNPSGVYLSIAGDFSMSSTSDQDRLNWEKKGFRYSTGVMPQYGVRLSFGWDGSLVSLDKFKDGTVSNLEGCSTRLQSSNTLADRDGCPDFYNDKIGKIDAETKCLKSAEKKDNLYFEDGCPDPEIAVDTQSHSPHTRQSVSAGLENAEIPDYENPVHGIVDSSGDCFSSSDDFVGIHNNNGCPDLEGRAAQLNKGSDSCKNIVESSGVFSDNNGCPDSAIIVPIKKTSVFLQQQVLQGLEFKTGKPELLFSSFSSLDKLAKQLKESPDVCIEVRGYTDALGKAAANTQLSRMRAEAVRQYLLSQGIDPQRIQAMGYGPSSPLGDNRTAAGRALNRRIEIVRTK